MAILRNSTLLPFQRLLLRGVKGFMLLGLLMLLSSCGQMTAEDSQTDAQSIEALAASSDDPTEDRPLRTGRFLDSAVQGLDYASGATRGATDATGTFQYEEGTPVAFSIGPLALGTADGGEVVTPVELVPGGSASSDAVINIARFLQTLDADGDPGNGIHLNEAIKDALEPLETEVTFDVSPQQFALQNAVALNAAQSVPLENGQTREVVSEAAAKEHLEQTLAQQRNACRFDGQTVLDNGTVTAYEKASVAYGEACLSEVRTCTNGVLSGDYAYASCLELSPENCSFQGAAVLHGNDVTAYLADSVAYGEPCTSEVRTCTNGVLSGDYAYASCEVAPAAACTFDGASVAHGDNVTAYASDSVALGLSCESEIRTCTNGSLSGSFEYASCEATSAASCSFHGSSIASGDNVTAYLADFVAYGESCTPEVRTCTNGVLSGDYAYASCEVTPNECLSLAPGVNEISLQQTDPTRSWKGSACLSLPESMTSLSLYGFGESSLVALENFFPQSQPEATAALQEFIWFDSNLGDFSSLGTQVHPEFTWDAGAWEVSTINVTSLKAVLRTTSKSASPTVQLAPFLASSQFEESDLADALKEAQSIFQEAGIQVQLKSTTTLESAYETVGDFDTAKTSEMVLQGGIESVNLFFVDDLDGYGLSGLLGKAAGIPGSAGVQSAFNGVLISLSGHEVYHHLDDNLLAETIAHESGHFLGLFHTSESNGKLFDPLSDTPECPDSQDRDQNQSR